MESDQQPADDIIVLNVGGRSFSTTRSLLLTYPDSMLAGLCRFPGNQHFLDRDPEPFVYVLSYMRSGRFHWISSSTVPLSLVLQEAQYYILPGLAQQVESRISDDDQEQGRTLILQQLILKCANPVRYAGQQEQIYVVSDEISTENWLWNNSFPATGTLSHLMEFQSHPRKADFMARLHAMNEEAKIHGRVWLIRCIHNGRVIIQQQRLRDH